jgi:hypothetical protein
MGDAFKSQEVEYFAATDHPMSEIKEEEIPQIMKSLGLEGKCC